MSTTRWPDSRRIAGLALLLVLAGCSGRVDRTPTQQARDVGSFDAIELRGGTRIDVQVGPAASLTVSGGADAVANLESRVENGTLVLQNRRRGLWLLGSGEGVQLRATLPVLKSLVVNGATSATITGVAGGELDLVVNGAASLAAAGSVDRLGAVLNGAGAMDLSGLRAVEARVVANGAGSIRVQVSGSLDASVNGVGNIRYSGSPAPVRTAISGLGSIAAE